jgi:hypothetical protein
LPGRIYGRVAADFPVRNNLVFAGAGVIFDDWELGLGDAGFSEFGN